ncbi:hypothetical protein [Streptomyces sp. NPDC014894]|uniref:hypothetical protein n=1 Tax=unclassified Streptomyces TaxID=2593676 RepID=UPI003701328F
MKTTAPATAPRPAPAAVTTLAELSSRTGLDVLAHLEREAAVPVVGGPQAQGDLIVVPHELVADAEVPADAEWRPVPPGGVELLRGAGGHPHTLTADAGACRWTAGVGDPQGLALGLAEVSGVAYLLHPEHGGTGIAPGRYLIRRQREHAVRAVGAGNQLIAD